MKRKLRESTGKSETSSEFFRRLRPSFLDWTPQTEEEKVQEAQARRDAKDAQLRRVTELEKVRRAEKAAGRKSTRGKAGGKR